VQQRRGCKFRIAGQEDCRAWNDMGRLLFQTTEQSIEWDFGASGFADENAGSAPPSQDK
jgi:hypothetical protein